MSDTLKSGIYGALITAAVAIVLFIMEQAADERRFQEQLAEENKRFVETMSEYFEEVDKEMSYKDAIQTVYNESEENKAKIEKLEKNKEDYEKKVAEFPEIKFYNPSFINDGLKEKDSIEKAVVTIDGRTFYSESFLNSSIAKSLSFDSSKNTVFNNIEDGANKAETKIDLFKTGVLYDGLYYHPYTSSDSGTISMGSKTYNKGFTVWVDNSLFGEGSGYALFDLEGKYSKISFEVGRANGEYKSDAVLQVYLNNEHITDYQLSADSPPQPLEIDLNYASDMKLSLDSDSSVIYGFVNVVLYY